MPLESYVSSRDQQFIIGLLFAILTIDATHANACSLLYSMS